MKIPKISIDTELDEKAKNAYFEAMTNTLNPKTFSRLESIMYRRRHDLSDSILRATKLASKLSYSEESNMILVDKIKKTKKNIRFSEDTKKHDDRWCKYDELFQRLVVNYIRSKITCIDIWDIYCNSDSTLRLSHLDSVNDLIKRIIDSREYIKELNEEDLKEEINEKDEKSLLLEDIDFFDYYDQLILLPHDGKFRLKRGIPILRQGGKNVHMVSDENLDILNELSRDLNICHIEIAKPYIFLQELPDDDIYDDLNTCGNLNPLYSNIICYSPPPADENYKKMEYTEGDLWSMF